MKKYNPLFVLLSFLLLVCISASPGFAASRTDDAKDGFLSGIHGLLLGDSISDQPNRPPIQPSVTMPEDGATNSSIDSVLSWFCYDPDNDTLTYDIFLEKDMPIPTTLVADDITGFTYKPDTLMENSVYYWQVVATDEHGSATAGPVWSFTTGHANQAIVVDHRHTDISKIPDQWLAKARQLAVHYAHTSHGSQVLSGLEWLEDEDALKYGVKIVYNLTDPGGTDELGIYDGNNYKNNSINPDKYWKREEGIAHTRQTVGTGYFDYSLWTWCGQMSYYPTSQVQEYLDTLAMLDNEYPATRFIYYTGHTDGTAPGSTLWTNNNLVREYVQNNDKILFDFADIESYSPDGTYYPDADDSCDWCEDWCKAHPGAFSCRYNDSCAHSHPLQCALKGQAFWYLMARLAGWDGVEN